MNATMAAIELENTYTSGVYSKRRVVIERGDGALLWDIEGREYIDCAGGHGAANIGHGRAEIAAAIAAQAHRLITCPEIFYNETRARLLERLAQLTPAGLDHIFLCNSGTEAVEGALKFARLAMGRTGIVATLRSFHGRTMGALSATWEPHYRQPFAPLIPGVSHIRYNDLAAAEAAINEDTAAVIIELVQGEGGVHVATEEYVQGLARLCGERGALLIVDEVQTGFGRTGRLFACEHYDLQPDILCLAKSMAGGVPMGAICLGPRVMESGRITIGAHGSTFGGNPLACAAALSALDIMEQESLAEHAAELGEYALQRLRELCSPLVREVRGQGLLLGIELNRRAQPYLEALLARSVLALPAGPNVMRLLPPLVITREQLDRVMDCLAEVLDAPAQEPGRGQAPPLQYHETGHTVPYMVGAGLAPALGNGDIALGNGDIALGNGGTANREGGRPQGSPRVHPTAPALTMTTEVGLLHGMLTIASYSGQEGELATYLVEQVRRLGLFAEVDEAGNFVASTYPLDEVDEAARPVVLLGHMDTVRGYIAVRVQDGALYGRGAVDAKGPLAAFVCAAARLTSSRHARPVVIVGAVEEEAATSRGARAVVERYRPEACIIGEPSGSQAVTIGYKGRLLVDCVVTRAVAHSAGARQNSSEAAIALWNRVQQHASNWNEQHAGESAFAALMPSLRSINSQQDGFEDRTCLRIGYRLPPGFDMQALRALLEDWAVEAQAQLEFSGEEAAFQTTRTTPLARAFISSMRAKGGKPVFKHKTGTSDMNVVGPLWGENIVAYGPGDSRLDHTPHEHIQIDEYMQAIDVLELVLNELIQQKETRA